MTQTGLDDFNDGDTPDTDMDDVHPDTGWSDDVPDWVHDVYDIIRNRGEYDRIYPWVTDCFDPRGPHEWTGDRFVWTDDTHRYVCREPEPDDDLTNLYVFPKPAAHGSNVSIAAANTDHVVIRSSTKSWCGSTTPGWDDLPVLDSDRFILYRSRERVSEWRPDFIDGDPLDFLFGECTWMTAPFEETRTRTPYDADPPHTALDRVVRNASRDDWESFDGVSNQNRTYYGYSDEYRCELSAVTDPESRDVSGDLITIWCDVHGDWFVRRLNTDEWRVETNDCVLVRGTDTGSQKDGLPIYDEYYTLEGVVEPPESYADNPDEIYDMVCSHEEPSAGERKSHAQKVTEPLHVRLSQERDGPWWEAEWTGTWDSRPEVPDVQWRTPLMEIVEDSWEHRDQVDGEWAGE